VLVERFNSAHSHMAYDPNEPSGKTIANLFEAVAEEHLMQPTIIYEFPTAVSPLSKQKRTSPIGPSAWEIFIGQMEISNGFSELNDPEDQRRRFEQQLERASAGTKKLTRWTKITFARSRMACRRREAWASASIG
jgi:lysyl-tRNA synthetase class 2